MLSIIASAAAGFLVKLADDHAEAGVTTSAAYALAILYGASIGAVCYFYPPMLTLWLAALAGVIAAGKIDSSIHLTGVATVGVSLFLISFDSLLSNIWLAYAIPFLLASFADERFHESENKLLRQIASRRLFLDAAVLLVTAHYTLLHIPSNGNAVAIEDYMFVITLFCFDIAYFIASRLSGRLVPKRPLAAQDEEEQAVSVQTSQTTSSPAQ